MFHKKIQKMEFLLLFSLSFFKLINSLSESMKCLQVNQFDGLLTGEKVIGDKNNCFKASKQCCFINITHYYGDYLLKQEYCNYLNVNITEFQEFLYNLYNDDEMFYANFTAHNLDMYRVIGRNLETKLTETLNCFKGPRSNEEYSTYVVNNCQEFVDGVCTGKKNTTRFNAFVENFQKNYSNVYCNKKEEKKKCIRYNGARANDKMVKPLMDELIDYLRADKDEYIVNNDQENVDINSDEDDIEGNTTYLDEWKIGNTTIKKCIERPKVEVYVECPEGYSYQKFINIKILNLLLCFVLYLL